MDFKCKVLADPTNLTFADTDSSQNEYYDIRYKSANGKSFPMVVRARLPEVSSTVYIWKHTFGDDPGDTFIISGVARSRWAQDDYN